MRYMRTQQVKNLTYVHIYSGQNFRVYFLNPAAVIVYTTGVWSQGSCPLTAARPDQHYTIIQLARSHQDNKVG